MGQEWGSRMGWEDGCTRGDRHSIITKPSILLIDKSKKYCAYTTWYYTHLLYIKVNLDLLFKKRGPISAGQKYPEPTDPNPQSWFDSYNYRLLNCNYLYLIRYNTINLTFSFHNTEPKSKLPQNNEGVKFHKIWI